MDIKKLTINAILEKIILEALEINEDLYLSRVTEKTVIIVAIKHSKDVYEDV